LKRDAEFFEDRPVDLVYIARKLNEALEVEEKLTRAGIDYLVEVDYYMGGVIFRRERAGAFFYVEGPVKERVLALLGTEAPEAAGK
jgi:predicted amino acid racemase